MGTEELPQSMPEPTPTVESETSPTPTPETTETPPTHLFDQDQKDANTKPYLEKQRGTEIADTDIKKAIDYAYARLHATDANGNPVSKEVQDLLTRALDTEVQQKNEQVLEAVMLQQPVDPQEATEAFLLGLAVRIDAKQRQAGTADKPEYKFNTFPTTPEGFTALKGYAAEDLRKELEKIHQRNPFTSNNILKDLLGTMPSEKNTQTQDLSDAFQTHTDTSPTPSQPTE